MSQLNINFLIALSPPRRSVRRCPSLLWVQISKQLQPFLMKTIVAGICLFTWRHESFRDAARARYLGTPDQINMCCTALIDYFQVACVFFSFLIILNPTFPFLPLASLSFLFLSFTFLVFPSYI